MISRGNDFFSKSHINNPRKWWQKSKRFFKNMKTKVSLAKIMKILKILMTIYYSHTGKMFQKIKKFNNDQDDIEFKTFEEKIIEKFGLIGHNHLKEKFYKKYQNNIKWNIDDYQEINDFCNNLIINDEI